MTNKVIGILVSLIVLLGIAVLFDLYEAGPEDEFIGRLLFPDLGRQLDSIKLVEISDGENSLGLQKEGASWGVRERGHYPTDFTELSSLITSLSQARLVERKTSRPEKLGQLGLSEEAAVRLVLQTETHNFNLYLGDVPSGRKGSYVRFPDDNQAWLIDTEVEVKTLPSEWLDPVIINIDSQKIERVKVESPGGQQLEVRRVEGEEDMQLSGMSADQKLKYPGITNELSSALVNVRLKDLVIDPDIDWSDAWKIEFYLTGGGRVYVQTLEKNQQYFMNFNVKTDLDQRNKDLAGEDLEAEDKNAENRLEKYQKLQDYVFEVGDYVFGEFARTSEEFIE